MRRTKEEAQRTRAAIVDAALACFDRYGIGATTLEQVARAAGVSRGAVYHHFEGKREILRELREHVSLPLLDAADTTLLRRGTAPALDRIESFLLGVLDTLEHDVRKRQAVAVMQFKCEYVGDLGGELEASVRNADRLTRALENAYREAAARSELVAGLVPQVAALETIMFMHGLVRLWIAHANGRSICRNARAAIAAHIGLRRAPHAPPARSRKRV